ncbi:MAG: YggS family pyridoxal phosphate-dependent enzyme [Crocinitomicaceae bacterium]|nr:YggS family pyridoxal phosphate-dependent enzyme [Crocinitomicaceae bacterium]MBK8924912.1 YggS family pyridoxal phosphate-dependent enzyme [Crocinitomicaceae bacterium]
MAIAEQLNIIKSSLPAEVKLIAVSKTKPVEDILAAYHAGHRVFGENKVQELVSKYDTLPKDIEWHMIGHLQSNKVKYMAHFVSLIHGVDSISLLKEINKQAQKNHRVQNVLLQFHIATEETKFGLDANEANALLCSDTYLSLKNVRVCGVMGMASFTDNREQVHREFKSLKNHFDQLKQTFFKDQPHFKEISMGMSGDYQIAIQEGSTMVRVGSSIFGGR